MPTINELHTRLAGSERLSSEFREASTWADRAEAVLRAAIETALADAPTTDAGQLVAGRMSDVMEQALGEVQIARDWVAENSARADYNFADVIAALRAAESEG